MRILWLSHFSRNSRGSFTIESTLLFPLIFIITLVFIFAALFFYQKAGLYYAAGLTADRAAYSWDNSYKDPVTGAFQPGQNDGLYWRIFHDSVSDMFGFVIANEPETIEISKEATYVKANGPKKKLYQAVKDLTVGTTGSISYMNQLFDRRIHVELRKWFYIPGFAQVFLSDRMNVEASSGIIEPVEFIRSIDTIRVYGAQLKERGITKQQASEALNEFMNKKTPASFRNHKEAHAYLVQLTNGEITEFMTSYGIRKVDALDHRGISHQAYVTFNERQIREQMVKDVELLVEGQQIKGVVWHFFRRTNQTGKVGPSEKLQLELEERGIVVIVHD